MELCLKRKVFGTHYTCLPGFINILDDGRVMVNDGYTERMREMKEYDIYIQPEDKWLDLTYAYNEGFLDSNQLRRWS